MSTHVLLKSSKMRGLARVFYRGFFCNEFKKFNNTGERMLEFIHHIIMTLKLL